jgi:hypothetical protein
MEAVFYTKFLRRFARGPRLPRVVFGLSMPSPQG